MLPISTSMNQTVVQAAFVVNNLREAAEKWTKTFWSRTVFSHGE